MRREWKDLIRAGVVVCAFGALAGAAVAADIQPEKIAEAHRLHEKGLAAQKTGNDRAAVDFYAAAVAANPLSMRALLDLAYLQATSDDPAVRNPTKASANANVAMIRMEGHFQEKMTGQFNAAHPGADPKSAFLNMKACILNVYAAARAADNDFNTASALAIQSVRAAQALAAKEPSSEHNQMVGAVLTNQASIQGHQALHGTPPIKCALID